MWNNSLYGNYRQLKFTDVWDSAESFSEDWNDTPFKTVKVNNEEFNTLSAESLNILFYFLYSKFGNSTIASSDITQFKFKLWTTIWQYGPNWEKRLDLQNKLRTLSDDEIIKGTKNIHNHSFNPSSAPSTDTLDELITIDDQNTTQVKRSKIDAYTLMYDMLVDDITEEFINRFRDLFLKVVVPEIPLWYITGYDSEGNDIIEEGESFEI